MVKIRTQYRLNCQKDDFNWSQIDVRTKKRLIKIIRSLPLDWEVDRCLSLRFSPNKRSGLVIIRLQHRFDLAQRLKPLLSARSIRKLWHHWNRLIDGIIPPGFQVLTTGTDERVCTALSIRNRIKALVPTAYNCYLLDRDIRRYLKLELRHD